MEQQTTENEKDPSFEKYVVNCPQDGIQTPTDIKDWGDKIAEIMGKRMVTGNCPICHSTFAVQKKSIKP